MSTWLGLFGFWLAATAVCFVPVTLGSARLGYRLPAGRRWLIAAGCGLLLAGAGWNVSGYFDAAKVANEAIDRGRPRVGLALRDLDQRVLGNPACFRDRRPLPLLLS
jgi:hypothetical protein